MNLCSCSPVNCVFPVFPADFIHSGIQLFQLFRRRTGRLLLLWGRRSCRQVENGELHRSVLCGESGGADAKKTDGPSVPELVEQGAGEAADLVCAVHRRKSLSLVGSLGEVKVFDFHGDGACQLAGALQTAGYAFGQRIENFLCPGRVPVSP